MVDIATCPVLASELDALLAPLRHCLRQLQGVKRLGHVELVLVDNGPLLVLRHIDALSAVDTDALRAFSATQQVLSIWHWRLISSSL